MFIRLQGLAGADSIRDEDALLRLARRLPDGVELVGHEVHRRAMADVNAMVARDGLAKSAFHVELIMPPSFS